MSTFIQSGASSTRRMFQCLVMALVMAAMILLLPAERGETAPAKPAPPVLTDQERQKAVEFYQNRTISWVTFTDAGATTDIMLRMFLKYLPKYIPGNPRMGSITYMRGGGGTIAGNYLVDRMPRDGSVVGQMNFMQQRQFEGHRAVRFDVRKINWIANFLPQNDRILRTRAGKGFDTVEQLLKAERVNMGTFEVGHNHYLQLRLGQYFLGAPFHIIPGYTTDEMDLAIERGEIDGRVEAGRTFLSKFEKGYRAGQEKVHWSSEPERFELMPEVPTLLEVIDKYAPQRPSETELRTLKAIPTLTRYARYFGMPPGVPRERVLAIREGFYKTMHDPQFRQEFEKASGWPPEYTDGETLLREFTEVIDSPKEVLELFQLLSGPKPLPQRKRN